MIFNSKNRYIVVVCIFLLLNFLYSVYKKKLTLGQKNTNNTLKTLQNTLQKTTTTLGAPPVYNAFKTYTTFQLMLIDLGGR